ncbi:Calcium-binding mitochondrial carrier SAL1 [Zalerion maritima]|uniref:Mitochondrial thiamine pyrophosphate carrier 1 n=1 Tax=Zalerion maritima TaxID=339359 RepID=A0AAD5RP47_9PEZI|nr:Calcium-binding mitochondrial carrier SAL1 [Zalerion maritima]
MAVDKLVSELEAELLESQNQRDARVEELWKGLDPQGKGELDLKGLQKGLRRIDHPLKNADNMLRSLMQTVDTNNDGKIQYEEFRQFVQQAEQQLLLLFNTIDRDRNGKLEKGELQAAFHGAGLCVPMRRLTEFFDEIDLNNDGYISFDEWRDFLLFMTTHEHASPLHAVLSFYSSIVTLNAEGDSMVSEETLEGLGTTSGFLLQTLFGSILKIATPPQAGDRSRSKNETGSPTLGNLMETDGASTGDAADGSCACNILEDDDHPSASLSSQIFASEASTSKNKKSRLQTNHRQRQGTSRQQKNDNNMALAEAGVPADAEFLDDDGGSLSSRTIYGHTANVQEILLSSQAEKMRNRFRLTEYLPEPGYFVAGALAGGISRSATAPLDRLKVYLLVNTRSSTVVASQAVQSGKPWRAMRHLGRPVIDAVKDLWHQGGFRTFFAGNGLNVVKIMPETAIKFGSYEFAKRTLAQLEGHDDPKAINSYSKFAAGGIAGMIAQFWVYPLDTLKFRLQCETIKGGPSGTALLMQTARNMYASGGVRACYRGITMGLVGMFPYSAIDMGTFEFLKKYYRGYKARQTGVHEEDVVIGNVVTGIIGASSGAFGATVVYPLNVLRTRLQTQGTKMHPPTYTGIWDVGRKTLQNEGMQGMYKGLVPNLLKVAPALSITWMVYENSKRLLKLD